MKKILITITLMAIISSQCLFAQEYRCEVGVDGSPNISYISFMNLKSRPIHYIQSKVGFNVDVSFQYNILKYLSLKTGIAFEQNNYNISYYPQFDSTIDPLINGNNSLNYLTLPILIKGGINCKSTCFYANLGPYFSLLLNKEKNYPTDKLFDTGIIFGLGVSINIAKKYSISIEPRYNWGLYNINHYYSRNRSVSIQIGFAYKFKEKKIKKS